MGQLGGVELLFGSPRFEVDPTQAQRGQGVFEAVERFVARARLDPLDIRAGAAHFGDELFGGELGEVFVVEAGVVGEMDVARAALGDFQAAVDQGFGLVVADDVYGDAFFALPAQALAAGFFVFDDGAHQGRRGL